jgi:NAD(P)-dependent dehydrogenase (short-subunit alcohol dehydrogenase family)
MTADFDGKRVLVSGATSGIGRAAALAFAARGAAVAVCGRDAARGAEAVGRIEAQGGRARFVECDLERPEGAAAMVQAAADALGGLDVAVNNAGFQEPRTPFVEQPDAVYERVFAVNVRALFQAMKAEIELMRPQGGGAIVNVASVSGVRNPNPGFALYSAAKAAAIHMTKAAAMESAPDGIRVNAVSPGRVETPMMLGSGLDPVAVGRSLPAGRMGTPDEAAAAIVWLASDAAAFVYGHNLCVDGGFLSA